MSVRQVRIRDLVRKVNTSSLGLVDRTDKEVSSHVPEPQADYTVKLTRHRSVSKNDYKTFLRLGKPPPHTALVYWNFGTSVELISTRYLEVVNRTIEPGEVVKKVGESRSAMSGIVLQREVFHKLGVINAENPLPAVDNSQPNLRDGLESCFPHRLENISGNDIIYSRPYLRGDIVVYQGWFGDVNDVFEEIIVWFSDGRVIALEDSRGIQSIRPDPICVGELLDVGYIVEVPTSYIATKGRVLSSNDRASLSRSNDPTSARGVVLQINVNSIGVNWRGRKLGDTGPFVHPHPLLDLKAIDRTEVRVYYYTGRPHPTHSIAGRMDAEYSLGTYVLFRDNESYKRCSQVITETRPPHEDESKDLESKLKFNAFDAFVVIGVSSKVTVRWQDQSISTHASMDLLADEEFEDEHEQWPCSLVVPIPPSSSSGYWRPSRVGVVQSVVSSDRIAQVLWKDTQEIEYLTDPKSQLILLPGGPQSPFPLIQHPQGNASPEETSLYDIVHIPEMSFQILDLVMVIPPPNEDSSPSLSDERYDWIGQVMETRLDGMVVVRMGALNAIEDRVYPPDRLHFLMSRGETLDLVENSPLSSEENSELGDSPEYGRHNSNVPLAIWYENDQGERIDPVSSEDDGWSTAGDSTVAGDDEIQDESLMEGLVGEAEHEAQFADGVRDGHLESSERHRQSLEKDADSGATAENNISMEVGNSNSRVPKPRSLSIHGGPVSFDVLQCDPPLSHAFYGDDAGSLTGYQMRRIHKEHSILSNALPEGVYVRSWESRLDLFSVLIIGPPDTPYEFAPFLIDFRLPSTFPNSPPDAFFHSWTTGSPINPNLYQDGKICLSLLNTWNGTNKSEEWSPKESSLYQVLVSIQSLVLVKEPYYNEAGYDALVGADEAAVPSRQYSEWVYFNSRDYIKKMMECKFEPFEEVAKWLYQSNGSNGPKLLHGAIEAIKDILGYDGRRQQLRGGLGSVSKGALPKFKRQLEMLQSLVDDSDAMEDVAVDVVSTVD